MARPEQWPNISETRMDLSWDTAVSRSRVNALMLNVVKC